MGDLQSGTVPSPETEIHATEAETVPDLTFEELFEDLVNAEKTNLPDRYFTPKEYAEETGLSYSVALRRLKAMRDNDEIEGKKAIIGGYEGWAFWFSGAEDD